MIIFIYAAIFASKLPLIFPETTGYSPSEWLIRERLAKVKEYLESTTFSLSEIAEFSGFGSVESLRKHFHCYVLTSPIAYRKQFNRNS